MSFVQSTRASMPGTAAAQTKSTTPAPKKATPSKKLGSAFRSITAPILAVLAAFLRAVSVTLGTVWRGFAGLLKRILPDESLFHLSPTTMIFIAVAVPVVMSTIGGVVYIRRGRAAQHQLYYEKAFLASQQAIAQSDPAALRTGWQTTLNYLDKAEFYGETEESAALRKQAQGELDLLDRIIRLDFKPAIVGGLDSTVHVSHIVTNPTDIYLR